MALKQSFSLKLQQKLSPQQIQLMKMLQLPTLELEQRIKEELEENPALDEEEQLEIGAHYLGYMEKQEADIIAFRRDENLVIPENMDYSKLSGLSNEVKYKFKLIRPKTLGQALRIDGITPAAAYILLSHLKKTNKKLKRA